MQDIANVILRSAIIYLFIIIGLRIFGKKELGQLSVVDLVFILLISNAVQNAMVGDNTSLSGGLAAATTLFAVNFILKQILYRSQKVSSFLQGNPVLLIYRGMVLFEHLDKVKLTIQELEAAMREHGLQEAKNVDLAVLEIDGNISIISHDFTHKTSRKRKAHKTINKNF